MILSGGTQRQRQFGLGDRATLNHLNAQVRQLGVSLKEKEEIKGYLDCATKESKSIPMQILLAKQLLEVYGPDTVGWERVSKKRAC